MEFSNNKPTVIDLFAGAGLFGFAFEQEGFQITQSVERDRVAATTHALNLRSNIDVRDITCVRPEGRCDVLIGGPPCQGFSTLGKRREDDPRNRLCLEIARWAKTLRPSIVVVENVAPFVDAAVHTELRARLRRQGYKVEAV